MPVVVGIIAITIQIVLMPLISFQFVVPDIVLIVLVIYTLKNGQIFGTITGFIFGLLFDIFSGGIIGAAMFSKTLAGFTAGYFYSENKTETNLNTTIFVLIIFVCAAIDALFYQILISKSTDFTFVTLFVKHSFLPAFYTALLSLIWLIFKPKTKSE